MELRQIWTLYVHELRSALRERSIVVFSIIIPLVLYPGLLWAGLAAFSFVEGQAERIALEVGVHGLPDRHRSLLEALDVADRLSAQEWVGSSEEGREEVSRGGLDVLVEFVPPDDEGGALEPNFRLRITYHGARDRSRTAREAVESVVDSYREGWIDEARQELDVDAAVWADFRVIQDDLTTAEEGTRFLLGLMVPFLTLIVVALATFYPAIDATAGERERGTWETLMTVAAPRANVATAKYLYVATLGAVGGLLNMTALTLSLRWIFQPVLGAEGQDMIQGGIPLGAFPIIAAGTVLLGLFVAAGMLVFAVFARNFKEGQSMVTPFYIAVILPAIFLQSPDIEFTTALALAPVVNVALLIREAIMGSIPPLQSALTLGSMAVFVALAVVFAQWVMRREEVLVGSQRGGLGGFLRRRVRGRRSEA